MDTDARGVASVVVGSLLVAGGSTLAGINAFAGRVAWVVLGFALFVAGYGVSQYGVHADGWPADAAGVVTPGPARDSLPTLVLRGGLLIVGITGIAVGVTTFARTILVPSFENAVISGVFSIGGYMVAHLAVNRDGLGWAFVTAIRARITARTGDL